MTVKEVLHLAIETDLISLAHHVFWAVSEEKIQVTDEADALDFIDYDKAVIAAMIEKNVLGIGKVKLYVVRTKTPELYAFYYGENVLEVNKMHQQMFRERPEHVTDASHLFGEVFHFNEDFAMAILYFHRSKVNAYPYYVGHAWAGKRMLYRLD